MINLGNAVLVVVTWELKQKNREAHDELIPHPPLKKHNFPTRASPRYQEVYQVSRGICQPNRFKQAGFPANTIGYLPLQAQSTEIQKNMTKNAPFGPVRKDPLKTRIAHSEP